MMRRMRTTQLLHKKIAMLPEGMNQKIKDCSIFCRPTLSYGWIDKEPNENTMRKMDGSMWKAVGRTGFSNPHLRHVVAGANNSLRLVPLLRQVRLLAQRNDSLRKAGEPVKPCSLDSFVTKNLCKLGWSLEGGRYRHPLYREGFRLEELVEDGRWRCVSHHLRESFRAREFMLYSGSSRHDVVQEQLPAYCSERRKTALQWAEGNNVATMLLIGGVQSPHLRFILQGKDQQCPKCGALHPHWDHGWRCFVGMEPPQDCLLRRNLWPRHKEDFTICYKFLEGITSMMDC